MENEILHQILNKLNEIETSQKQMQFDITGLKSDVNQLKANTTRGFENVDKGFDNIDTRFDKLSKDMGHLISHEVGDAVDSKLDKIQIKIVK